jgi:ribonuclease HI
MLLDTKEGVFIVPEEKRARVMDAVDRSLIAHRVPVRAVASIKGQLLAMGWAFGPWSRLRTRGLGRLIEKRRSWSSHLALSDEAREDLLFWKEYFTYFNSRRGLWEPTKVYSIIHCDAAGSSATSVGGWGAWTVLGGKLSVASGGWSSRTRGFASTPQELQAVLNALQSFRQPAGLDGHCVRVITDNLNSANIINKGAAKADACYEVAYKLLWWCVERDVRLQAEWRPRGRNQLADYISKMREPDDWSLRRSVFRKLEKSWGPFDIDLFSSASNHHLPAYYSRFFTPDTAGVDAFRFRWGRRCWANPPFGLLLRVLQHAKECRARLCLIAPIWPTRDWWPVLTWDGLRFQRFVLGVRVLGWAPQVLKPGERSLPRGAGQWQVMALLLDFAAENPNRLTVPADPLKSPLQKRR